MPSNGRASIRQISQAPPGLGSLFTSHLAELFEVQRRIRGEQHQCFTLFIRRTLAACCCSGLARAASFSTTSSETISPAILVLPRRPAMVTKPCSSTATISPVLYQPLPSSEAVVSNTARIAVTQVTGHQVRPLDVQDAALLDARYRDQTPFDTGEGTGPNVPVR